jgi:two-component system, cell cycle response regulator
MALRVLLADESSTIKKVFQLALQDFAVEVRSVNIGVDVATVATAFKPDIIFADVLLQKKNGYDVCAELKGNALLKTLPIVLMWSGFMELDEDKFQASHANAQLEKPFDVTALRKLITDLVPRTQNQKLSEFLTFPKTQAEAEQPTPPELETAAPDLGSDEEFTQVPIPKIKGGTDKYRLDLKPEELEPSHIPVNYEMPSEKIVEDEPEDEFKMRDGSRKTTPPEGETIMIDEGELDEAGPSSTPPPLAESMNLSSDQLEQIIRQQSAEVIEAVVWKVVPELAKQIIERELNRLLKERDSHPY